MWKWKILGFPLGGEDIYSWQWEDIFSGYGIQMPVVNEKPAYTILLWYKDHRA